jgi:hypothetical protein
MKFRASAGFDNRSNTVNSLVSFGVTETKSKAQDSKSKESRSKDSKPEENSKRQSRKDSKSKTPAISSARPEVPAAASTSPTVDTIANDRKQAVLFEYSTSDSSPRMQ